MSFICGQPWRDQYPFNDPGPNALGAWTVDTSLPSTMAGAGALLTKDRVYLLGGVSGSTTLSTILTAPVDSGGVIGTWATDANSLPAALAYAAVLMTDHRVYLIGGHTGSASTAAVLTAEIDADGVIGTWTTDANSLPGPLHRSALVVTTDRVYLLGGFVGGTEVGTVYTAAINSDGTLGSWSTATSLPVTRSSHAAFATESYVYLLMDYSDSSVYRAPINGDGTIGTWAAHSTVLTWASSPLLTAREKLWMIGGYRTSTIYSAVRTAAIDAAENLGSWGADASLPAAKVDSMVVATSSRVYAIGGSGTSPLNAVYYAAWSGGDNDYLGKTVTGDPVPVRAALLQAWGLFSAHLTVGVDQQWHLMAEVLSAEVEQFWGIRLGADLSQRWSDAPVLKGVLNQPWGNAGVVRAQLVQRWRDMVTLRARLDQPWAIMESLLAAMEQPWAITSGPVQALLDQGWTIKDIEPVLALLHQPWAIASDGTVLRYTVEVLADGQPVRVSHVNIEGGLDESGDVLTCEIHPETEAEYLLCPFGAELQITITSQEGADVFVFVVAAPRIDEQHGSTNYVVEGMSPAVLLGAPYADGIEGELSGLASEIAATLAGAVPLSWETVDWHIPAATWIASGETPLALLKTLAAAVGALVQSDPDGIIAVRPRYQVAVPQWVAASPDIVLTETLDCFTTGSTPDHRYGYNRFLISNQSSSADSLTLEQSDISTSIKEVRGYQVPWDGRFELTHTGGIWVVIESQGIEEREVIETVEFVAGAGSTQYPVYGLVSVNWQQTNLGTITTAEDGSLTSATAGQSLCEITYLTRCRLWKVTDPQDEQLQLVAEV